MVATRVLHSAPTISASPAWLATSSAEHLLNVTICSTCKLMRWLFAFLCFIDTEKIIDTGEDALRTLNPGKIIGSEKIIDTGEDAVRTWGPGQIIETEKIIDTGEEADPRLNPGKVIGSKTTIDTGEEAVRTWNPGKIIDTEKTIDTGEDADPRLNPGKVIDTEKIPDPGEDEDLRLNPGKVIDTAKIIDTITDTGEVADPRLNPGQQQLGDTVPTSRAVSASSESRATTLQQPVLNAVQFYLRQHHIRTVPGRFYGPGRLPDEHTECFSILLLTYFT